MNAGGAEVVAWVEGQDVMATVRQPGGGAFAPPARINTPASAMASANAPSVAIDAAGNVLVAWSEVDGSGSYSVQLATAAPGQVPVPGAAIPGTASAVSKVGPQVTFLDDGTALVVWASFSGAVESTVRPPGGSFSAPASLANSDVQELVLAPESGNRALLSWRETKDEEIETFIVAVSRIKTVDLSAAGTASGLQTIGSSESHVNALSAAANPAGDGLVSYAEWGEEMFFTKSVVRSAYRAAGGAFQTPATSFPTVISFSSATPNSGLLADGTALVSWDEGLGKGAIQYAQRSRGGSFPATAQTLVPEGPTSQNYSPRIVALGEGAMLTYVHNRDIVAQPFSSGGPEGAPVTLSSGGTVEEYVLAGDGEGDAVAVWNGMGSEGHTLVSAGYDAGPRLSALAVPASGVTGASLPFSVVAVDPLSPLSVDWTFGDGAKATGASVTHAYSAPGAQSTSVVAIDAAGLASAPLAGVTQVGLAPASPPGTGTFTGHGVRSGSGPPSRHRVSLKISKQRLRDMLRKGLAVTVGCPGPCKLGLALQVPAAAAKALGLLAKAKHPGHPKLASLIGRLSVTLKAAGTKTVYVRLTKAAKARLRHTRKLTLSVIETVGGAGVSMPLVRQVTLR